MDSPSDLIELKRQLFDYFELSQKNINQKINLITNELDSLKKENEIKEYRKYLKDLKIIEML